MCSETIKEAENDAIALMERRTEMNRKSICKVVTALLMMLLLLSLVRIDAKAAAKVVEKKTEGDITWTMYADGVFKVSKAASPNTKGYTYDKYKNKIKSVVIENGITEIWGSAFSNTSVSEVSFPDSVKVIDDYAFAGCENLTSIKLPKGLETINAYAFRRCKRLTSIDIPDSVKYLGDYCFGDCYSLAKAKMPSSLKYIGDWAFGACRNLENVTIPGKVTEIGYAAFRGCRSFTSVKIPSSVTSFGKNHSEFSSYGSDEVFKYCRNLTSVSIPNSLLKKIDVDSNFSATPWLLNRKGKITGEAGGFNYELDKKGSLTLKGSGILYIPRELEVYDSVIKSITITEDSKYVSLDDIWVVDDELVNLEKIVNKSSSVIWLNPWYDVDFSWYDSNGMLKPIDSIGKGTAVRVKNDTRFLFTLSFNGNGATSGKMKNITDDIGDTVIIPGNSFVKKGYVHSGWSYIVGGKTYTVKSGDAITISKEDVKFKDAQKGLKITVKAIWEKDRSVSPIGTNLKDKSGKNTGYVVTNDKEGSLTVKYVGTAADRKKKTLTIRDTVKDLNGNIYKVTAIGAKALKGDTKLVSLTTGKNVTLIEAEAFSGCSSLTTANLNSNLSEIEGKAFYNCSSLTKLVLSSDTTTLGYKFAGKCKKLKLLTVKSRKIAKKTLDDDAFLDIADNVVVAVPSGMTKSYTKLFRANGLSAKVKIKETKR